MKYATGYQILLLITIHTAIHTDTMWVVYNMRMAATTRAEESAAYHSLASGTVFNVERTHYDSTHTAVTGGLATYIHTEPNWYGRVDFAVGNSRGRLKDIRVSRVQTDDILFTAGYGFSTERSAKITLSGMIGIPTHNDEGIIIPQFGTGHLGLGAQIDGAFTFRQDPRHSVQAAIRLIHFLPQEQQLRKEGIQQRFMIDIGNLADGFFAYVGTFGPQKEYIVEAGYNPQFLFNTAITPQITPFPISVDYVRHIFYTSWVCKFKIGSERPHAFSLLLSYAFDSRPKTTGNKHIWVTAIGWGINF